MTVTPLIYLVAREHINDRMREVERERRAADVRPPRWVAFSFLGRFTPGGRPARDGAAGAGSS
jgi:hypothetical protein